MERQEKGKGSSWFSAGAGKGKEKSDRGESENGGEDMSRKGDSAEVADDSLRECYRATGGSFLSS